MKRPRSRRHPRQRRPRLIYTPARGPRAITGRLRRTLLRPDLYHRLLTVRWTTFFVLTAAAYVVFNAVFAALYRLDAGGIANVRAGSFADAFFFSVQTMATIGYGEMHPVSVYANVLVAIEVLLGLMGFALATGVIFARFSRPTARVLFSRVAVIDDFDGRKTFMLRAANQRRNRIVEATASLTLARDVITKEGLMMRRFFEARPERGRTPLFALTWTVMHAIDEASPLFGATPESLAAEDAEIIVSIIGLDETLSQTVHARHSYHFRDIKWGHRFADILSREGTRIAAVDYGRFHDTVGPGAD